jgi:hypothetical protein
MESADRAAMGLALYPVLRALLARGELDACAADRAVAACAEGCALPTNLDLDPSVGGLAPASPQAPMRPALRAPAGTATRSPPSFAPGRAGARPEQRVQ